MEKSGIIAEYLPQPGVLPNAHRTLGQKCLAYMNYDRVQGLPVGSIPRFKDMPFLEY